MFTGSRFDVGLQMGRRYKAFIRTDVANCYREPPPVKNLLSVLLHARRLLDREFPAVAEELGGLSVGAGVEPLDLMLTFYEELWDSEDSETGCTDIVADGRATFSGRLLLGHNNDEGPDAPEPVLTRLAPTDGPVVTAVALGGVGLSVGVNSFGLVLTGNQLTASDIKPGIPRLLLVRAALDQPTIEAAAKVLLHPARASSYNNILADQAGRVVSIEGSGDKAQLVRPKASGILTHSNHYLHPAMGSVEDKGDMHSTVLREQRSCQLMERSAGLHNLQSLAQVLRDHRGFPASICRHGEDADTGFSVLFEPEARKFWFVEGNPCGGRYRPVLY